MSYHGIALWGLGEEPVGPTAEEIAEAPMAPTVCPDCAFLDAGTCKWCPDNSLDIPGCEGCVSHKRAPPPWYKRSDVLVPMAIAVATTVAAGIITNLAIRRIQRRRPNPVRRLPRATWRRGRYWEKMQPEARGLFGDYERALRRGYTKDDAQRIALGERPRGRPRRRS